MAAHPATPDADALKGELRRVQRLGKDVKLMSDAADLQSWRDTDTRRAIVEFVQAANQDGGPGYVPPAERIAVLDNDGTLWTEKPMPIQLDKLDAFDDGPEKPLRIWARTGRRPAIAVGNSNGDLEMLRFAGGEGKPALRLVVRHDDADREVTDTTGAGHVLDAGFTEISTREDWETLFLP